MESANLHHHHQQHHHQLQDQHVIGSPPPLATPSCYGLGTTHAWTPNTLLNPSNFSPNSNGVIINSRDSRQQNDYLVPSLNSPMIQDLGFQWGSGNFTTSQSGHDSHLARKGTLSEDHYPKLTEMIHSNNTSSSIEDFHLQPTSYTKNEQRDLNDLSEKLLLRNFSGCQINGIQIPDREFYSGSAQNCSSLGSVASRGNFSQIFPTINISNLNQSSSAISSSMDMNMNMQALDLFTSGRFSGCLSQVSHDNLGLYKDSLSYAVGHMQQSNHRPSNSPSKILSPFTSGITEAKRPSSFLEPKVPQAAQKKSRSDSRSSCPPFKVRKEKLGDRIAALQQLVAPFGKTDTASVLMEAIGYIKFLQNQVETLSVPYMKSSRNKTSRTMRGGQGSAEDGNEEPKRDLKSRGLCLVPLSCLSYVTDGGGGVWPNPNFNAGT